CRQTKPSSSSRVRVSTTSICRRVSASRLMLATKGWSGSPFQLSGRSTSRPLSDTSWSTTGQRRSPWTSSVAASKAMRWKRRRSVLESLMTGFLRSFVHYSQGGPPAPPVDGRAEQRQQARRQPVPVRAQGLAHGLCALLPQALTGTGEVRLLAGEAEVGGPGHIGALGHVAAVVAACAVEVALVDPAAGAAQHGGEGLAAGWQQVGGAVGQLGSHPAVVEAAVRLGGAGVLPARLGLAEQATGAHRLRVVRAEAAAGPGLVRAQLVAQQLQAVAACQAGGAVVALGAADVGPGVLRLLAGRAVVARRALQLGAGEVGHRLGVATLAQQAAAEQLAQGGGRRASPVAVRLLVGGGRRGGHLAVHIVLQLGAGEYPLGHFGGVLPVAVATAVELVEGLQVVAALQRQDGHLALHPAAWPERLDVPVGGGAPAPVFLGGEGSRGAGVGGAGGVLVAPLQGQLGAQPPGQTTVAGALEEGAYGGVVAMLVAQRGQAVGQLGPDRRVLQQAEQTRVARCVLGQAVDAAEQLRHQQLLDLQPGQ